MNRLQIILITCIILVFSMPARAQAGYTYDELPPVYKQVDVSPAFPGNLNDWLLAHAKIADADGDMLLAKTPVVRFVISESGSVTDACVVESSGNKVIDKKAMALVGKMPAWRPGFIGGKPVKTRYQMAIPFAIDKPRAAVYSK